MRIHKEAIICWIIGAILVFFGTSVKSYIFETIAVVVIIFGVALQIFWDDLFKASTTEKPKEPIQQEN